MTEEVCKTCGLPKDLCVCETIAKEQQKIQISGTRRRYGKPVTIVKGIDPKRISIKELGVKLKQKLACGGTVKGNTIELQGKHGKKTKEALISLGFPEEQIEVV